MQACSNFAVPLPVPCTEQPTIITPSAIPAFSFVYAPAAVSNSPVLADFIYNEFLPAKSKLKNTTLSGYLRDIKLRIVPCLGHFRLLQIDHAAIQSMIDSCETRAVASNARETLSSILGCACEKRLLPYNAAIGRYIYPEQVYKTDEPYLGYWLTNFNDIALWLNIAREECPGSAIERILLLGFCEGLRKSEILGMDGERINLRRNSLFVCQAYTKGNGPPELHDTKTPKSIRHIPLMEYARERIEDIGTGTGPWITDKFGKRYNPHSAQKAFTKFRVEHDLPRVTMATLRHSFATSCIRSGMDIATLATWLGHTDAKTTLIYTQPSYEDLCVDAAVLNSIMSNSLTYLNAAMSMRGASHENLFVANKSRADIYNRPLNTTFNMTPKMTLKNDCEKNERSKMAQLVLNAMIADQRASRQQIAKLCNVSLSTVRRAVDELKEQGIVKYKGSSKNGYWAITMFD